MKKIIALAVASAFVTPAFAADVQISGEFEHKYVMADSADKMGGQTAELDFSATEELGNGITIKGHITFDQNTGDGGEIVLSGAFGKLEIGDAGGPLDNADGLSTGAPTGGGLLENGQDMSIVYQFPAMVPGVKVEVGMSPDGGSVSAKDDASGYAITYSGAGLTAYYGKDEIGTDDVTQYGISYSAQGITVGYESADLPNETDETGMFAAYKFSNIEVGVETQVAETAGVTTADVTVLFAQYHLGPVDIYVAQESDDAADEDSTTVGIEYIF